MFFVLCVIEAESSRKQNHDKKMILLFLENFSYFQLLIFTFCLVVVVRHGFTSDQLIMVTQQPEQISVTMKNLEKNVDSFKIS